MDWTRLLPTRRWLRFGLRSLLVGMLVVSVLLGWYVNRAKKQAAAVKMVLEWGGTVIYAHQWPSDRPPFSIDQFDPVNRSFGEIRHDAEPPGPAWLRRLIGEEFFVSPRCVFIRFDDPTVSLLEPYWLDYRKLADLVDAEVVEVYAHGKGNAAKAVANLARLPRVRCLAVSGGSLTNESLRHVAQMKGLEELQLNWMKLDARGLAHLRDCAGLRVLDLGRCELEAEVAEPLAEFSSLAKLRLPRELGPQTAGQLSEKMPNCSVSYGVFGAF